MLQVPAERQPGAQEEGETGECACCEDQGDQTGWGAWIRAENVVDLGLLAVSKLGLPFLLSALNSDRERLPLIRLPSTKRTDHDFCIESPSLQELRGYILEGDAERGFTVFLGGQREGVGEGGRGGGGEAQEDLVGAFGAGVEGRGEEEFERGGGREGEVFGEGGGGFEAVDSMSAMSRYTSWE